MLLSGTAHKQKLVKDTSAQLIYKLLLTTPYCHQLHATSVTTIIHQQPGYATLLGQNNYRHTYASALCGKPQSTQKVR